MKKVLLSALISQEQKSNPSAIVFSYVIQKNTRLELINDLLEDTGISEVSHEITIIVQSHACLHYYQAIQKSQSLTYTKKLSVVLEGEGASACMFMRYILIGAQKFSMVTEQRHLAIKTKSELSLRTALYDNACVYNKSIISVFKNCYDVIVQQENKNLLLSPDIRVITKPEIDIRSSHVKCTHGAITSPVNQEQTWYLMSKGILEKDAQKLIINGFLNV